MKDTSPEAIQFHLDRRHSGDCNYESIKTAVITGKNPQLALYAVAYRGINKDILIMHPDQMPVEKEVVEVRKIPNRVSTEPTSEFFLSGLKNMGVKLNGIERKGDCYEFDIAEGWMKVHLKDSKGRFKRERGRYVTVTLKGVVEAYWKDRTL